MSSQNLTQENLERRVSMGRSFILIYTVLSVINVLLVIFGIPFKFISSISSPYYLVLMGKGLDNGFVEGPWPVISDMTIGCAIFAALLLLIFFSCWAISKKHMGWVVVALVFFILDVAVLVAAVLFLYRGDMMMDLLDLLFHIWIIILLARCIAAHKELCWRRDEELLKEMENRESGETE